jgi:nitrogen regulatory protein P-II 1
MKKVEAVIRPHMLDRVKERLGEIQISGMTVSEVRGFGRTGGKGEVYRGSAYEVDFVPKLKLDIVVNDALVPEVVEAIVATGKTGKIGDGKIFITEVAEVIRIRTGERADDALKVADGSLAGIDHPRVALKVNAS